MPISIQGHRTKATEKFDHQSDRCTSGPVRMDNLPMPVEEILNGDHDGNFSVWVVRPLCLNESVDRSTYQCAIKLLRDMLPKDFNSRLQNKRRHMNFPARG